MEKTTLDKPLIKSPNLFPVVGIGASAGGLDAFKKLLKAIPEDSGMAYVLVQHLDPSHESMLPELLQKVTKIPVLEIADDIKLHPDHIYVIPSNKMMVATDGVLLLAPKPAKSKTERNLPIDLFFKSLAEVHQEHAIGVVLSGTASDGTQGLKAIKEHGGITFAQDEASAEYEGMPHSAILAGVVDFVLPPDEIPKKLLEVTNKTILSDGELQNIPKEDEDVFKQILSLLRIRKGVDFTYYKQTTIRRRILRRMVVNKNEEPTDYLKFLRGSTPEQDLLYQDLLIPVTSFFRDKRVFENLCNNVFPAIVKNKMPGEITRIWVAGCSTGQEVYSFAICFKEFLGDNHERIQIFGTDLSEPAIAKARTGIYEKNELDSMSPERLKEYFTKNNGGYQVNKSIRDLCVFAHHNFLKDPPFGKMDCISCRNVLIYMEPYLQKKALTTFHYALNPKGFLLLGKSETTGGVPDLFAAVEKTDKLYTRKDVPGRFMQVASQRSEQILNRPANSSKSDAIRTDFQKTADDILLTKYTPAGVVVNEAMDIVHFRGNTGNYLEQAPGKPSHNLLMMAKHGLGFELRNILHKAKTEKAAVVKENIPVDVNGTLRIISIEAVPLPNTLEPYYLILFHDNNLNASNGPAISKRKKVSAKAVKDEKDIRIQLLEQELSQLREDMRSITEEQEASNEELQSANEELLSGSEELQSLNEELETSKEELQSTNEELTVLNHELVGLNEQVTDARNYSESIVATLYQPLLVLDKHLRVKTANKAFYKTFNVNEQETEGVLVYDLGNRQWNIPELRTLLEEILPQKKQITDFEVVHNFSSIGERIILLNALELTREKKEEKLILLSIEDITEQRLFQLKEKKILSRYHNLLLQTPVPISIFRGSKYLVELVNDAGLGLLVKDNSFIGKLLFEVMPELENTIKVIFDNIMQSGIPFIADEIEATLIRNGRNETGWFNVNYQPIREDDNTISGILAAAIEVTDQVLARRKIEESDKRYNMMLMKSPFAFAILKGKDMVLAMANDSIKEMWGKGNEIEGKPLIEVLPELKGQGFTELLDKVYTTGIPYIANEALAKVKRNGKMEDVYFNFVYQPYRETDDTISGVTIIAIEVTNEVIAKQKIKDSQQQLQNIFMQAPFALNIYEGKELVISLTNKLFCEIIGKTESEILGKKLFDAFPETATQGLDKILSDIFSTGIPFKGNEFPVHFLKHGNEFKGYFDFIYQPIFDYNKNVSGVINVAIDVTDKVLARKKIEESEFRYHEMIYSSPSMMAILKGEDMIIEIANDAIIKSWGKGKDIIGKSIFIVLPETMEQGFDKLLLSVFKTGQPVHAYESPVTILRNGIKELVYYSFIYQAQHNVNGTIEGVAIIANEVTPQAELNKRIKESEAFNRAVLESSPDCIKMLDGDGRLEFINSNGVCLLEIDDFKSVQNTYWWDMWQPENQQLIKDAVAKAKGGEKVQFQVFRPTAKGTPKWWDIIVLPVQHHPTDKNLNRILSVSRDITKQKQSELKEKELLTRFQTLVIQAPVAICVLRGKDYIIEVINKGMYEMWDRKIEDVINKPAFDVLPEFREQGLKELLDNVLLTGEPIVLQELPLTIRRHNTMENIFVKFVYEPLREADGTVSGVMALAHEITEQVIARKKIEESENQFREMAELMPQKIWTADAEGNKNYFNQTLLDYVGFTFEELKGSGWQKIIHPDDWEKNKNQWEESLSTGQDYEIENRLLRKDGEYLWHLTRAVALKDDTGEIKMWVGSKTEIQKIKEEDDRKGDFIKMVSHELKTPVTSIKGYVQMLLMILSEEHVELFPMQIKNSLLRVDHQVTRLTRLITEMLDLSRIEAGKLELQQELFSINALVKDTVDDIRLTNPKHTIHLLFEFVCNMYGDRGRIEQVVINLVTNAIKYSANNNKVEVSIRKGEKNMVLVSVRDFGIGIDKADHKKIFDRFFRVEGKMEQTFAGFGIGLFIAKEIIVRHNGYITVDSEKGQGSVFTFAFPYTTETNL